ncbi:MAG TPA: DUF4097 family beta strand repeat-containing protein [Longimicrobiaceae bacterium]|nr:DUF4097 family beta strand repeat-containing protein [Longimicrobiaceae bacterium]
MRPLNAGPRFAFVAITLALSAYAAATPTDSPARGAQRDFDWNGELRAGATLRVYTVSGTVTVRRSAGGSARVHGVTVNGDREAIRYVSDRDGGDVRVCALRDNSTCDDDGIDSRGGRNNNNRRARANFTVEVPRGVVVRVSSGNGDVAVDGATADVHAGSGNGDVRVGTGASRVRASSGNGAVMVDGARGPVNASSGNGRVTVSTAVGPVEASTGNGSINVSMAQLRGDGDMEFSSGNGSITLTLPADFSAQVEAATGNGSFESDFPLRVVGRMNRHRVSGTIGDGGRRLRISTGNGGIHLRRAGA